MIVASIIVTRIFRIPVGWSEIISRDITIDAIILLNMKIKLKSMGNILLE